jgi:hypothetical protein
MLPTDDRPADVVDKIATYLAAGTSAVLVVDPKSQTVTVHDASGAHRYTRGERLTLDGLAGFALDVEALFASLRPTPAR